MNTRDVVIARMEAEEREFDPTHIRLSDVGACVRKQTLRIAGYQANPNSEETRGTFHHGRVWADYLAYAWEVQFPGGVHREVEVHHPYGDDPGHIDLYIEPLNRVIECKTTKSRNLRFTPYGSHVLQLQAYLHFWGRTRPEMPSGELVYVGKDAGPPVSYEVEYDPEAGERVEEVLRTVAEAKARGEVLPIPALMEEGSFPCSWRGGKCEFFDWCWGE